MQTAATRRGSVTPIIPPASPLYNHITHNQAPVNIQ